MNLNDKMLNIRGSKEYQEDLQISNALIRQEVLADTNLNITILDYASRFPFFVKWRMRHYKRILEKELYRGSEKEKSGDSSGSK